MTDMQLSQAFLPLFVKIDGEGLEDSTDIAERGNDEISGMEISGIVPFP
jgi:hypothetical protein